MLKHDNMSLYFSALMPPEDIQKKINLVKEDFFSKYKSRHSMKTPPHLTIVPPFRWPDTKISIIENCLRETSSDTNPFSLNFSGYGCFSPRVIFIRMSFSTELNQYYKNISSSLKRVPDFSVKQENRPYHPHITIATRDLDSSIFQTAWEEYKSKEIFFSFEAKAIQLLKHDGKKWNIKSSFPFSI